MRMLLRVFTILVSTFVSLVGHATGRIMNIPRLRIATYTNFDSDIYGRPQTPKNGDALLTGLVFQVDLINLDTNLDQKGSFYFAPSEMGKDDALGVARAGQYSPTRYMTSHLILCGANGGTYTKGSPDQLKDQLKLPQSVNWNLKAGGTTSVSAYIAFTGNYGNDKAQPPLAQPWFDRASIVVNPAFVIKVEDDRGAILATLSRSFITTSALSPCGSVTLNGLYGEYVSEAFSGAQLPINGGRPF